MADLQRGGLGDRDIDQAITALKKGAYLLKYGRRGKPKFCPFRLSADESALIWYYGKEEKQLELRHVSRIIPGQRTAIFQRYPRPEKEYQSFSLIYDDRSLDLICKDKDEAEVWFVGLKALLARGSYQKVRNDGRADSISSDSPRVRKVAPSSVSFDQGDNQRSESIPLSRLGKAFADIVTYTATTKNLSQGEPLAHTVSSLSAGCGDNPNGRNSTSDNFRVSLSSAVSSSSQGSCHEDFDSLGDVFIWGEGTGDGLLGGGVNRVRTPSSTKVDALFPRPLESTTVIDAHVLACGSRHAALVTKQGEVYSWGEESGGRLGHGAEVDVSHPKLVDTLNGLHIEKVACGEYHSCAVTLSGDLYTWGDGTHNCGLLGHGSEASHWIPKKVSGLLDGIHVSHVSCGPWHTALIASVGQLFTFGDGSFGALGHGDRSSIILPREVDALKGLRTLRVACGVWHTAAIVEIITKVSESGPSDGSLSGQLFTWGDGDKGRLGHGDKETRLAPDCVAAVVDVNFCQVACGHNLTVALTSAGRVYTMGSASYGQLGIPSADGNIPTCLESNIADSFVEEIACGSHHVAVLTSKSKVYTWGRGAHGQLGHGDNENRYIPTRVDFLKDKQVKSVVCGSNLTAVICVHKWISSADNSVCFGCQNPFSFRRKRHNCYNCGLVFCNACSSRKSLKASLAPTTNKPYRVCDDCFTKLQKAIESGSGARAPRGRSGNILYKVNELADRETGGLLGQYPRLSSVDSFNLSEGRNSQNSSKVDLNDRRIFPLTNGNFNRDSSTLSKTPTSQSGAAQHFLSISVPSSRMPSRATSPMSGKASSPLSAKSTSTPTVRASEKVIDDMKVRNESLSQEVMHLRAQVEDLTSKYRHLEDEFDRKSRQLKEATALAADEAEKCEAAKEVIQSLSEQLKDMAERLAEGQSPSYRLDPSSRHMCNDVSRYSNASSVTSSQATPRSEANVISSNSSLSNGTKGQAGKSEWVVQDEPGVYVTLSALPGGGNELKRVRFSRKRFTEQQAEKWWTEHGAQVCEKHKVRNTE